MVYDQCVFDELRKVTRDAGSGIFVGVKSVEGNADEISITVDSSLERFPSNA